MKVPRMLCCLFAVAAVSSPLGAQEAPYAPDQVVVLVEPGAIDLPPGLDRAPADRVGVAHATLRAAFARHRVAAVGRAVSDWPPAGGAVSERRIHARRKGELMPPDALADLSLLYVLELPEGSDVPAAVRDLNEAEGIVYAEPSYRSHPVAPLHANDPLYTSGLNWGFYNAANPSYDVNAPDAWSIQSGLDTIRISIHDTGIERTHPDLNGGGKVAGEYDFVNGDADAYPDLSYTSPYHGTAVAGIAGAQTNNSLQSTGLCGGFGANQGCRILAAKVLGNNSYGNIHADATTWSINNGAKVINNSWCSESTSRATHDAFRNAYLSGVVVTAAMGNTQGLCGQDTADEAVAPASFSDILMAVGATDQSGRRITKALGYTWESGIGPHISVVAPGTGHYSLALNGGTTSFSGTSEATPFVSGLAGLLFSESQAKGLQLTPTDVRQIIQGTAKDLLTAGWDSETGHGLIDAGKALQVLQSPNQLTFASVGPATSTCYSQVGPTNWTFWASWAVKQARRCEVRRSVTFAKKYTSAPLVWGRPISGGGVTPSNPNSEIYWTGVVPGTVTTTGATLRTYAYEIWSLTGTFEGWYPAAPSQLSFAYGVLGQPLPFTVTAGAPGLVTVKATYSLTGSANYPATGWRWDRSDDGSPYSLWANAQNSQFIAYAGQYTIDWRLFARRSSDGVTDYGYASTQVCIPSSSSCLALSAPATAGPPSSLEPSMSPGTPRISMVHAKATGDRHFGSGVWIGLPNEGDAIRFYPLTGDHAADGDWPNLLDRESVTWLAPAEGLRPGAWIESRRSATAPGVSLYTLRGRLSGSFPAEVSLGLVADPDLGARPSDDTLGFDEAAGLAWVGDRGPSWIGYLALGPQARQGTRLRQFGIQGSADPDTGTLAFQAMAEPSRLAEGQPSDVRFVLTLPAVPLREDGSFVASFAVIEGASLSELRDLAAAIREAERNPSPAGPTIR